MDNPEKLATRRGNHKWTIQRNWQHEGAITNGQSRETGSTKGQSQMDNPEKLAAYGTQGEDKQNKSTTQYALNTTIGKQSQIM